MEEKQNEVKGYLWKTGNSFNMKLENEFYVVLPIRKKQSDRSPDYLIAKKKE